MVNSKQFNVICYLAGTPDNHEVSCKNINLVFGRESGFNYPAHITLGQTLAPKNGSDLARRDN